MPLQAKPTEEAISQLLHADRVLHPPANAKHEGHLKDFDAECKRAAGDPEAFGGGGGDRAARRDQGRETLRRL